MKTKRQSTVISLAVWLMFVLIVGILGVAFEYNKLVLCSNFQKTTGTIDQKFPNNHLGFSFDYKVEGHGYEGNSYAGQIGRSFDAIQLGDTVTVFYNTRNPSNYTLEIPNVLLVRTVGQIIAACAILPIIGLIFIRRNGFLRNYFQ